LRKKKLSNVKGCQSIEYNKQLSHKYKINPLSKMKNFNKNDTFTDLIHTTQPLQGNSDSPNQSSPLNKKKPRFMPNK